MRKNKRLTDRGLCTDLPCDVGDTVYLCEIMYLGWEAKVMEIQRWSKNDWWFKVDLYGDDERMYHMLSLSDFGKTWVLSKEQAERKDLSQVELQKMGMETEEEMLKAEYEWHKSMFSGKN